MEGDYSLPERGELGYLIGYLNEMGEAQQGGNGLVTNSWQEIKAWSELNGVSLSSNEASALKRLSSAYVAEYYRSNGKMCAAPGSELPQEDVLQNKLGSFFSVIRSAKDGG